MSKLIRQKRKHRLRGEQEVKTLAYAKKLFPLYHGYIKLPLNVSYQGHEVMTPHLCLFCGEIVSTKPSTLLGIYRSLDEKGKVKYKNKEVGRGCTVCKTNSQHISEYVKYLDDLKAVHGNKFVFPHLPLRFKRESTLKEIFKCNDCGSQHYQTPLRMLDPKFRCGECERRGKRSERTRLYEQRLKALYGDAITFAGKYHDSNELQHTCDRHHTWLATAKDMLRGKGCSRCKTSVSLRMKIFTFRNKEFVLRNRTEFKAIQAISDRLGGFSDLRTSFDFPNPLLSKKNASAFYHSKSKTAIDVIAEDRYKKSISKIVKRYRNAEACGLFYGLIIVGEKIDKTKKVRKKLVGLWSSDWLSGLKPFPKEWDLKGDKRVNSKEVATDSSPFE